MQQSKKGEINMLDYDEYDDGYNDGLYDVLKEARKMIAYDMQGLERYEDDFTITIRQLKQIVKKLLFEEVL